MIVLKLVFFLCICYKTDCESDVASVSRETDESSEELDLPYEENPKNFPFQKIEKLLNLTETFYMVSRTYDQSDLGFQFTCLTARSLGKNNNGTYSIKLTASVNFEKEPKINLTALTTPYKSGNHTENNAMNMSTNPSIPEHTYKLMYFNEKNNCAIIRVQPMKQEVPIIDVAMEREGSDVEVVAPRSTMNGCELMLREDSLSSGVPQDCGMVYDKYCIGEGAPIFNENCYEFVLPTSAPPEFCAETL